MRIPKLPAPAVTGALYALVGAAVLALCFDVLWSWHGGEAPVRLPFWLERIQYDTAWAFALMGGALIAFSLSFGTLARLFAAVPIVLGSVRLAAYAFPDLIPIRPMIAMPGLPYGAGGYNDMGVLTALVLIVLGLAVVVVRPAARSPLNSVIASLLAAIGLALALLLLFGAWTGGPGAMRWLMLTGSDRTNALLAILVASVVLADALSGSAAERHAVRRWTPIIVWFAVFVCVLVLWRALALQEAEAIRASARLVALSVRGEIERDLGQRAAAVERLGERARARDPDAESWLADSRLAIRDFERFQQTGWIDSQFRVRIAVPQHENDLLGVDVREDPAQGPAARRAATTRKPAFTRFIDFVPGGHRFTMFVPVYDGDAFRGLVSATVMGSAWFDSLVRNRFPYYEIELREQETRVEAISGDSPAADPSWAVEQPIRVADADWTLVVTPTQETVKMRDSVLPEALLALGALLATLLALCTYLFQMALARARDSAAVNARLLADIEARKRAEIAHRESEERTRLIIAAVKDHAIYMLDAEGRIASWNPGATELTGYLAGEVLGRDYGILYPPDVERAPSEALTDAVRDGWTEQECWHLRKDGSRYRGEDVISAMRDDEGTLQGFSVVTRDATQKIELREQTERSRDFYFSLFSDFPNLVWRSDATGGCDYVNKAWLDFTAREREAELGDGWTAGIHPDDRAAWDRAFAEALRARAPFEIEFRLRRKDGAWGSLICSGRPYHDMKGGFSGFLCSCYDNTERHAIESALKESEHRYEAMTSNVPGMVFQLARRPGGELAFAYISHGCEPLTGLAGAALLRDANAFFSLVSAVDRPHLRATLESSAAQMSAWNWSGRLQPAHEPTEKWVTIRARPRAADGRTILWDGVVLDDTANRLAQLEIERSREEQRALSRHLQSVREEEKAAIARELHDELGSSLTALKIDLDRLQNALPENGHAREQVAAMLRLLDSCVTTTRRIVTDLRPSILDDLGLAAALRWQAGEFRKRTGTKIVVETPDPDIHVDRECALTLFRIFQETLTNVARHAGASEVDVRLADGDAGYLLQVRDNGVGMSDDAWHKPASHGIRGMRERARELGGDLSVASAPGEGTTLVVTIPKPKDA